LSSYKYYKLNIISLSKAHYRLELSRVVSESTISSTILRQISSADHVTTRIWQESRVDRGKSRLQSTDYKELAFDGQHMNQEPILTALTTILSSGSIITLCCTLAQTPLSGVLSVRINLYTNWSIAKVSIATTISIAPNISPGSRQTSLQYRSNWRDWRRRSDRVYADQIRSATDLGGVARAGHCTIRIGRGKCALILNIVVAEALRAVLESRYGVT
jgi:hypothetical protein